MMPPTSHTQHNLFFRHAGLEPVSSRRAAVRREEFFQPEDLGWLDAGSNPV
jgi:hypothetical protein